MDRRGIRRRTFARVALASGLVLAGPAAAQTVLTLAPTQDTYVDSMVPDVNFGSDVELMVGRGTPLGLGNTRTLVQFDIPPLANPNLRRATLRMRRSGSLSGPPPGVLHRITSGWDASTATWNLSPTYASPIVSQEVQVGLWRTWDVTGIVADIDAGTSPNHGWLVKVQSETAGISGIARYHSVENTTDPALAPCLSVEVYDLLMTLPALTLGENAIVVTGVAPGALVTLAGSLEGFGNATLPTGAPTELKAPVVVDIARAEASGRAVLHLTLGPSAAGQTWFLQAVTSDRWSNPGQALVTPVPCEGELHEGATNNGFGEALAMDGDHLVAGAPRQPVSPAPQSAGAVYVFRRDDAGSPGDPDDDGWLLEDELLTPSGLTATEFGAAVAIEGDTLVVGAWQETGPGFAFEAGAAYVYVRDDAGTSAPGDDSWLLADTLRPPVVAAGDRFGWSVDVHGEDVLVGAPLAAQEVGRTFLYRRDDAGTADPLDDTWPLVVELRPRDNVLKRFGWSVALDDARLFVGAPREPGATFDEGAVFVYRRPRGRPTASDFWPTVLTDPYAGDDHKFGFSLAADGGHLLVGSVPASRAYVFRATDDPHGSWVLESVLEGQLSFGQFSESLDLRGGIAVIGARYDNVEGAAWVYRHEDQGTADPSDDVWRVQDLLMPGIGIPVPFAQFGLSVAVSGDLVTVGSFGGVVNGLHRVDGADPLDPADDVWEFDACLGADGGAP